MHRRAVGQSPRLFGWLAGWLGGWLVIGVGRTLVVEDHVVGDIISDSISTPEYLADKWAAMTNSSGNARPTLEVAEASADRAAFRRTLSAMAENHLILASRQKVAEEKIERLEAMLTAERNQSKSRRHDVNHTRGSA